MRLDREGLLEAGKYLAFALSIGALVLLAGEYVEGRFDTFVVVAALLSAVVTLLLIHLYGLYRRTKAQSRAAELIGMAARGEIGVQDLVDPAVPTCWELKNCHIIECPVYGKKHLRCWQVEGTFCRGEHNGSFPEKLDYCYKCEVFRATVRDDPVLEMEARFQDMLRVISEREATASDMYQRAELQRQMLEFLLNLSRKALSSLELDSLLELVLNQITGQVADFAAFYTRGRQGPMELRAQVGFREGMLPRLATGGDADFVDEVMAQDGVLVNRDIMGQPWFVAQFGEQRGNGSIIGLPLICRGRKMGVLVAGAFREQPFSHTEMQVFRIAGDQIAMAVFNAEMYESVSRLAATDGLTGLANHRAFYESLDKELGRASRYGRPLSLLMIDIDYFKDFNDTYGHPQGDKVLAEIAKQIKDSVRVVDTTARYGGEEFTVLLPETPAGDGARDHGSAFQVAERMRDAIARYGFEGRPGRRDVSMTVSIGIAAYPDHAQGAAEMVYAADIALYRAKEEGRNKVMLYRAEADGSQAAYREQQKPDAVQEQ